MFKSRKRTLIFDLPPIDNGSHIQQSNTSILTFCSAYQICGYSYSIVLLKCAAKLIKANIKANLNFICNAAILFPQPQDQLLGRWLFIVV